VHSTRSFGLPMDFSKILPKNEKLYHYKKIFLKIHEILPKVKRFTKSGHTVRELVQLIMPILI
jgi:hypothetical protein